MKKLLLPLILFLLTFSSLAQESSSTEPQRKNGVTVSDTLIKGIPFRCYQYYFASADCDKDYTLVLPMPETDLAVSKIRRKLLGNGYSENYEQQLREEFAADSSEAALNPTAKKDPYENENYIDIIFTVSPTLIEGDIIIFSSYINEYFGGASHPTWAFFSDVFNLSTGEEISQDDILEASEKKRQIVARKLYTLLKEYKEEEDDGEQDVLYMLNNNFYFTDKELIYAYTPYEVAEYVYGEPELSLPKKWLKPYLNPDGPLYQYWFGKKKGKKK